MSESTYAPGVYVKDGVERNANSARQAVALVFDGFKPKPVEVAEPVSKPEPVAERPAAPRPTPPKKSEDDK